MGMKIIVKSLVLISLFLGTQLVMAGSFTLITQL